MDSKEKIEDIREKDALEEYEEYDEEYDEDFEDADVEIKPLWQLTKESWYSKLNVSVKQLDIIIALGVAGLIVLAITIGLDATGII